MHLEILSIGTLRSEFEIDAHHNIGASIKGHVSVSSPCSSKGNI
jgi:hypothetical protein